MISLLRIDGLNLALPQSDILTLEPVEDLLAAEPLESSVGWVATEADKLPVYDLNDRFELVEQQTDRRILVVLHSDQGGFALMVNELEMMDTESFDWQVVPVFMRLDNSPIERVAVNDHVLVCASSANKIASNTLPKKVRQEGIIDG